MSEIPARHAGEIAAITLVVRQLLARLPQSEQDAIRAFAEGRLKNLDRDNAEVKAVLSAAEDELNALFTAAVPE